MPFIEILAPPAEPAAKAVLVRSVTDAITAAFGVGPETVTLFLAPVAAGDYAHAGELGGAAGQRAFVKVHAFRRDSGRRRAAAAAVTEAVASALAVRPDLVAVYFLDRERDEVAHAGVLASDEGP